MGYGHSERIERIMDRRTEELVYLRKAYRRERRSATGAWKFFFTVSILVCLVMAPGCLLLLLPQYPVTDAVFWGIETVCGYLGWGDPYGAVLAYSNLFWITLAIAGLVLLVSLIMWIAGSSKLRRTDAWLSYKTLRRALQEEARLNK